MSVKMSVYGLLLVCKHSVYWRFGTTAYVYPASTISIDQSIRAIMGYSRASSQSLCRALSTWTFSGFAGAGSTCSPSYSLLCNRV